MAKKSSVEKNNRRKKMIDRDSLKRAALKEIIYNKSTSQQERFSAVMKLAELPRNGAKTRYRNRCELSGRARGYYRHFNLSRIWLRELASKGELPGVIKASW